MLCIAVAWQSANAATLTVNDSGDEIVANSIGGTCTLREAILAINAGSTDNLNGASGPSGCVNSSGAFGTNDQILFDTDRTITTGFPESGLFILTGLSMNPLGPNQRNITLNANNRSRHFAIATNGNGPVFFANIEFINGNVVTDLSGVGSSLFIQSSSVVINRSTITNNTAQTGGAIALVRQSTPNALLVLNNSTVSGNSTINEGNTGGIISIGETGPANVELFNSTIASNGSSNVFVANGEIILTNSIIADSNDNNCVIATDGTITSDAVSIIEGGNCGSSARTIDPGLISLRNNGGGTRTHALALNSEAVNTGNNATCLATDQRGEARPATAEDSCDVGAFEQTDSDREQLNTNFIIIPINNNRTAVVPL